MRFFKILSAWAGDQITSISSEFSISKNRWNVLLKRPNINVIQNLKKDASISSTTLESVPPTLF
jgi:hypothetical protein